MLLNESNRDSIRGAPRDPDQVQFRHMSIMHSACFFRHLLIVLERFHYWGCAPPLLIPGAHLEFSGRQSHRGKNQGPVAWVAFAEETKRMKPTDKAALGAVSESPGRNESEPIGGLDTNNPKAEPFGSG